MDDPGILLHDDHARARESLRRELEDIAESKAVKSSPEGLTGTSGAVGDESEHAAAIPMSARPAAIASVLAFGETRHRRSLRCSVFTSCISVDGVATRKAGRAPRVPALRHLHLAASAACSAGRSRTPHVRISPPARSQTRAVNAKPRASSNCAGIAARACEICTRRMRASARKCKRVNDRGTGSVRALRGRRAIDERTFEDRE